MSEFSFVAQVTQLHRCCFAIFELLLVFGFVGAVARGTAQPILWVKGVVVLGNRMPGSRLVFAHVGCIETTHEMRCFVVTSMAVHTGTVAASSGQQTIGSAVRIVTECAIAKVDRSMNAGRSNHPAEGLFVTVATLLVG